MNLSISQRDRCRNCGSSHLNNFLTLPKMPLAEGHVAPDSTDAAFVFDLKIYWCKDCGVVQTLHDIDLADYYADYDYTVSSSSLVQTFMRSFADESWRRFGMQPGDVVIEIGSSDGYQLKCYKDLGAKVLGFEPAAGLVRAARGMDVDTLECLFTADTITQIPSDLLPAQAVIAQYTFDHLPDPTSFLETIKQVLDPHRGVVIIEVHDFEKIVERREACLLTHEHSIYLSEDSIERVFAQAGFRLVCTDLVPEALRRGNSLIGVGTPADSSILSQQPKAERASIRQLREGVTYEAFAKDVLVAHQHFAEAVRKLRCQGKRVAGYGAAGRGVNTILIAGLTDDDLVAMYDMNTKLQGMLMPGTRIPVKAPEALYDDQIDEVIVFCYGYLDEIRQYFSTFTERGGRITSMLDYLKS